MFNQIGIVFLYDFLNNYGGAILRLKAELAVLQSLGKKVRIIFPARDDPTTLTKTGQQANLILWKYFNFQRFTFIPAQKRVLLDQFGQGLNPFFYAKLVRKFRDTDLILAHFPCGCLASCWALGTRVLSESQACALRFSHR